MPYLPPTPQARLMARGHTCVSRTAWHLSPGQAPVCACPSSRVSRPEYGAVPPAPGPESGTRPGLAAWGGRLQGEVTLAPPPGEAEGPDPVTEQGPDAAARLPPAMQRWAVAAVSAACRADLTSAHFTDQASGHLPQVDRAGSGSRARPLPGRPGFGVRTTQGPASPRAWGGPAGAPVPSARLLRTALLDGPQARLPAPLALAASPCRRPASRRGVASFHGPLISSPGSGAPCSRPRAVLTRVSSRWVPRKCWDEPGAVRTHTRGKRHAQTRHPHAPGARPGAPTCRLTYTTHLCTLRPRWGARAHPWWPLR